MLSKRYFYHEFDASSQTYFQEGAHLSRDRVRLLNPPYDPAKIIALSIKKADRED